MPIKTKSIRIDAASHADLQRALKPTEKIGAVASEVIANEAARRIKAKARKGAK